jgi:hypothetical protein
MTPKLYGRETKTLLQVAVWMRGTTRLRVSQVALTINA